MLSALEKESDLTGSSVDLLFAPGGAAAFSNMAQGNAGGATPSESDKRFAKLFDDATPQQKQSWRQSLLDSAKSSIEQMKLLIQGPEKDWNKADQIVRSLDPNQDFALSYLTAALTPSYSQVLLAQGKANTQLRLLGLHARVIAYRWRNGRLPATLQDAAGELAKDPFSGNDFMYEATPGGYRLLSRGSALGDIELRYRRQAGSASSSRDPNDPPQAGQR